MMGMKIDYLEEEGIVVIKIEGGSSFEEHKKKCREILEFGRERGSNKFLADHRNIDIHYNILQIDDLPKMFREIGFTGEEKVALLHCDSQKDKFEFFSSASYLANLNFRPFSDEHIAMEWLKSETDNIKI